MLKLHWIYHLMVILLPFLPAREEHSFPAAWEGKWAGALEIFSVSEVINQVPMELHILALDTAGTYTWTLIYGEDKEAGKRAYELKTIDAAKGIYLIDEKNSIAMEAYLLGGKLYNRFEVAGSLILVTTELAGEELIFEVISGSMEPVSATGGEEFEGEDIPPVKAFPVQLRQRAVLKRS